MKLFKQTLHRFAVLVLCVSLLAGILLPAQAATTFSPAKETPEPTPASAFTVSTAGSITKYSGNDTNIVIPKAINDTTIVSIGAGAFSSVTGVKNIVIPSTVKYVGSLPGEDDLEGVYFYGDCPTGLDGVLEYTYYADVTTIYCKSAYRSNFEGLYGLNGDWEEEEFTPSATILSTLEDPSYGGSATQHNLVYTDNGNGTHNAACTDDGCIYTITNEAHTYDALGICLCGARKSHNLVYTNNGDGTHSAVCSDDGCTYTVTNEAHSYDALGVCLCGAKEVS